MTEVGAIKGLGGSILAALKIGNANSKPVADRFHVSRLWAAVNTGQPLKRGAGTLGYDR